MKQHSTFALSHMADCRDPEKRDSIGVDPVSDVGDGSPGAQFLRTVEDVFLENCTNDDFDPEDSDGNVEMADSCVPVYTFKVWQTFVDLAAWQEDVTEYGEFENMEKSAMMALYMIAERLVIALGEEWQEANEEEV